MNNKIFYPPEWYPQDAVMLSWPERHTDWKSNLEDVRKTYVTIISILAEFEKVVVLCDNKTEVKKYLKKSNINNVILIEAKYNDTWTRDYGPITIFENNAPKFLDFQFNGWGNKYDAVLDNSITKKLYDSGIVFNDKVKYANMLDYILEGGSIDTDGNGTLLTTTQCLLSKQRNPGLSQVQIEDKLKKLLGIKNVLWLNHGEIGGDDTDGHIDTLAKFCDENTIVYASSNNSQSQQYLELKKMEEELKEFEDINNKKYNLVNLPIPEPKYSSAKKTLPATYVNFLITNEVVLIPAYNDRKDEEANNILTNIFRDKKIISIDCVSLIQQYGSLHCITMQLPKATLINN